MRAATVGWAFLCCGLAMIDTDRTRAERYEAAPPTEVSTALNPAQHQAGQREATDQYEGTIKTTGTHSAFGMHGSPRTPFTCYWATVTTWTGTIDLSRSQPAGHWDIVTVATPSGSDHPDRLMCGGFTVGPYHVDHELVITGHEVKQKSAASDHGGIFSFHGVLAEDGLTGFIATTGSGVDDHSGHFRYQSAGSFSLPPAVHRAPR